MKEIGGGDRTATQTLDTLDTEYLFIIPVGKW